MRQKPAPIRFCRLHDPAVPLPGQARCAGGCLRPVRWVAAPSRLVSCGKDPLLQVEEAEIDAAIAEREAWKAAGRPGLKSHEEFMAEVFGGSR